MAAGGKGKATCPEPGGPGPWSPQTLPPALGAAVLASWEPHLATPVASSPRHGVYQGLYSFSGFLPQRTWRLSFPAKEHLLTAMLALSFSLFKRWGAKNIKLSACPGANMPTPYSAHFKGGGVKGQQMAVLLAGFPSRHLRAASGQEPGSPGQPRGGPTGLAQGLGSTPPRTAPTYQGLPDAGPRDRAAPATL